MRMTQSREQHFANSSPADYQTVHQVGLLFNSNFKLKEQKISLMRYIISLKSAEKGRVARKEKEIQVSACIKI